MDKNKLASVLNRLANKDSTTDISRELNVSTRTIYEIIRDFPLFGGLVTDKRKYLKVGRRKPVQRFKY